MKNLLALIAAFLLVLPPVAVARDARSGPRFGAQVQEKPVKRAPGPQQGERRQRGDLEKSRPGKLTQEERRELHRDLDRANREIYRRR
jgi:hypothetical protein